MKHLTLLLGGLLCLASTLHGQAPIPALISIANTSALPDGFFRAPVHVSVGTSSDFLTSGSIKILYDPALLQPLNVQPGPLLALNPPDFSVFSTSAAGSPAYTIVWIQDISPPLEILTPAGDDIHLADLTGIVLAGTTVGSVSPLESITVDPLITTQYGSLGLSSVSSEYGDQIPFSSTTNGSVSAVPTLFQAGDANASGNLSLVDPIAILQFLFLGVEVDCVAAVDVDDSGDAAILDAINLLTFMFLSGPSPGGPCERETSEWLCPKSPCSP